MSNEVRVVSVQYSEVHYYRDGYLIHIEKVHDTYITDDLSSREPTTDELEVIYQEGAE